MKTWTNVDGHKHHGNTLGDVDGFDVIDCIECGFAHAVPIPTEDFLSEYYKDEFVKNRPEGFYKKMESDVPWMNILYNEKYDLLDKYVKSKKPSILDIGSGLGYFLVCGKKRGWKVTGIEPSKESCDYSEKMGLNIINAYLNKNNSLALGKFDVVHMHEVIEHLPDPLEMVSMAEEMLNPGGILCIASPNDFNPLQESFVKSVGSRQWWIGLPEHINYFNFQSIENLLTRKGFSILHKTSTFPLEFFLLMGDNYIDHPKIGKTMHQKRVNFEVNMYESGYEGTRRSLYEKFADLGIGREFIFLARKSL